MAQNIPSQDVLYNLYLWFNTRKGKARPAAGDAVINIFQGSYDVLK